MNCQFIDGFETFTKFNLYKRTEIVEGILIWVSEVQCSNDCWPRVSSPSQSRTSVNEVQFPNEKPTIFVTVEGIDIFSECATVKSSDELKTFVQMNLFQLCAPLYAPSLNSTTVDGMVRCVNKQS